MQNKQQRLSCFQKILGHQMSEESNTPFLSQFYDLRCFSTILLIIYISIQLKMRRFTNIVNLYGFSTITHIRGKPQLVDTKSVKLRGVHIKSTSNDSPNLIFFPEAFDQVENWLSFFSNPENKIIHQRNVYILYPRNFGTSDHSDQFGWEDVANDVARFMYENRISSATLGGHGMGGKVALAAACYHFDKTTGYFGFDTSPMQQYYHEPIRELRNNLQTLKNLNISRSYAAINAELRNQVLCPKWRNLFLNNLIKAEGGYAWNFNLNSVYQNLVRLSPSNLSSWSKSVGLYPGRSVFIFPEHSRYVHLNTNTLPMYSVCPRLQGFNQDIFAIQGDDSPQSHWIYEREQSQNPFAYRLAEFIRHYDGVHVLLRNRDEVGNVYVPDQNKARVTADDFAGDRIPAHYHHNWRFSNVYSK